MSVTVEGVNEAFEVGLSGLVSEITIIECRLELATSVKTAALILSKHVEHLGDACEGVFGLGIDHVSRGQHL
jgi:hypothetical protein